MSATLQFEPVTRISELHVSDILKRDELAAGTDSGKHPRLLVILENFGGREMGGDCINFDFMFTHGDKIAKIAIVGAGAREDEVRAFSGAGLRPSPVRFFPASELAEARAWLIE